MPQLKVQPQGQALWLAAVVNGAGTPVPLYSDAALTARAQLPLRVASDVTLYSAGSGPVRALVMLDDGARLDTPDLILTDTNPAVLAPYPTHRQLAAAFSTPLAKPKPTLFLPAGSTLISAFTSTSWSLTGSGSSQAIESAPIGTPGPAFPLHTVVTLGTVYTYLRLTTAAIDMTSRHLRLLLCLDNAEAMADVSLSYSLGGWSAYYAHSGQINKSTQAAPARMLESGRWEVQTITRTEVGLTGGAVAGAQTAVTDWQIGMTANVAGTKVRLGALYACPDGI
jgi:hypothetical protein